VSFSLDSPVSGGRAVPDRLSFDDDPVAGGLQAGQAMLQNIQSFARRVPDFFGLDDEPVMGGGPAARPAAPQQVSRRVPDFFGLDDEPVMGGAPAPAPVPVRRNIDASLNRMDRAIGSLSLDDEPVMGGLPSTVNAQPAIRRVPQSFSFSLDDEPVAGGVPGNELRLVSGAGAGGSGGSRLGADGMPDFFASGGGPATPRGRPLPGCDDGRPASLALDQDGFCPGTSGPFNNI